MKTTSIIKDETVKLMAKRVNELRVRVDYEFRATELLKLFRDSKIPYYNFLYSNLTKSKWLEHVGFVKGNRNNKLVLFKFGKEPIPSVWIRKMLDDMQNSDKKNRIIKNLDHVNFLGNYKDSDLIDEIRRRGFEGEIRRIEKYII